MTVSKSASVPLGLSAVTAILATYSMKIRGHAQVSDNLHPFTMTGPNT